MIKEIGNFLKGIPESYYKWRRRGDRIDAILDNHQEMQRKIGDLDKTISSLDKRIDSLEQNVQNILTQVNVIHRGARKELFETLHDWRQLLVVKRGWATIEEKKEVEEIYSIYSEGLGGNGNGKRYYEEILALPESEEERRRMS